MPPPAPTIGAFIKMIATARRSTIHLPSSRCRPPDNDDGRAFKSADGAAFSVFASYNAFDFDVAQYREYVVKNLDAGSVVTYQAQGHAHGNDWFVISGTKGDKVFYQRRLLSHGKQMTEGLVITYPASLKQTYDPIVARMAKSFRPGSGFQTP
jgi:hypothetical protein